MTCNEAVERIIALTELTRTTGTRTTSTVNKILQSLDSEALMEAAVELKRRGFTARPSAVEVLSGTAK